MSGFTRRYAYQPGLEVITAIEGVIVIDAPPPGAVEGAVTGVVCAVGEFADMTYATQADGSGNISTKIAPQEVFSGTDLTNKFGGFDEALGEFGISCGNGYVALRNKRYSRLVVAAVNLCSAKGMRVWRSLPMCKSQSDANPVIPVAGATVLAGREFRNGSGRFRVGAKVVFTARDVIEQGTGGSCSSGTSAATQTFNRGSGDWSTIARADGSLGARKGDILVIGYNSSGSVAPASEAGTYRVSADASSGTTLTVERLDGANFAWSSQSNVPYRLHYSTDADSARERVPGAASPGGYAAADAGGYTVPARPITNASGANTDGNWSSGTLLTPQTVPDALTGSSWDPLSGLGARTIVGSNTAFTAAVQGINAASSATIDALYTTAIDALLADSAPANEVNVVVVARKSATIRTKLKSHVLDAQQRGKGRIAIISPDLAQVTPAAVGTDSSPGVGATRSESIIYSWPGVRHSVPEAVGYRLRTADGDTTVDGILDDTFDFWYASLLSVLPPERNPGQAAEPVPTAFSPILGYQRGLADMGMPEYTFLRQKGVSAFRLDPVSGPIIQSGVTTSLTSGQKNVNRRRFSFFIQDSLAPRLMQFSKLPVTRQLKDGAVGEIDSFLSGLQSIDNESASRLSQYSVDDKSGNTPAQEAAGVFVIIVRVRMTPTADFIVLQTEIGENVVIREVA